MSIEHSQSHIALSGDVSSLAHEAILRQTVLKRFPQKETFYQLSVRPALPPGWALITEMTLSGLAETHSGTAEIDIFAVDVRGITTSTARWGGAASRIRNNLLPGMSFRQQVVEIRPSGSLNRQCIELFRTAMRGRRIEFPANSAELGTSASPLLDELIQIAVDCPASIITITGHTDSSGSETGNVALSEARAKAVAGYMLAGGIPATRIRTLGSGSSRPLVKENNARAQRMNRRIDIDIVFP